MNSATGKSGKRDFFVLCALVGLVVVALGGCAAPDVLGVQNDTGGNEVAVSLKEAGADSAEEEVPEQDSAKQEDVIRINEVRGIFASSGLSLKTRSAMK